ncbi:MAG: AAA family ATPase [Halioglobus sp.]|nr:AAA family ATPase [Halioglobus sp.]
MSPDIQSQQVLIQALCRPSVFPHATDDLTLLETHISWVILCGDYAYKIKKALDLGFLDCSTLERRKLFCEEELRLNRRLAPDLYLEVVPITGTVAQPSLAGRGAALEYAVKMRRFPSSALLSDLVDDGRLGAGHIDQLAAQIASFHQRIAASGDDTLYGTPGHVHAPALENFSQIRERIDEPRHLETVECLHTWTEQEYQRCAPVFEQRKRQGFIRECHGDMHLGNMVMIADAPVIFDGIEFNPELYWIDVMSEIAFLCMDLEHHGRPDYANRFLNAYLELTGDYEGVQVYRYYLVYRAIVRAKVASIRVEQVADTETPSASRHEFDQYLQLALQYSRGRAPVLLITHGLSGSGKSTLSARLAGQMGAIRIRSDRERQRLLGRGRRDGQAAGINAGVYSEDATAQTYAVLEQLAESVLSAGCPVIVDATFLSRAQREPFRRLAARLGVPLRVLSFQAEPEVLRQRVVARDASGRDISEADLGVLEYQLQHYEGLDADEASEVVVIDTQRPCSGQDMAAQLKHSLPEVTTR